MLELIDLSSLKKVDVIVYATLKITINKKGG